VHLLVLGLGACDGLDSVLAPNDGELCRHDNADGGCSTDATCERDCSPGDRTFDGKDVARFRECTPPSGACAMTRSALPG
jgi:hypothetical protein